MTDRLVIPPPSDEAAAERAVREIGFIVAELPPAGGIVTLGFFGGSYDRARALASRHAVRSGRRTAVFRPTVVYERNCNVIPEGTEAHAREQSAT